ncbi:alanine dehydrogenase [Desulfocurvus sp. DL9XJH121]
MKIGIAREIKPQEGRVAFLPAQVRELATAGHEVYVEKGAGALSRVSDEDYAAAGAKLLGSGEEIFATATMVVKVKEILPPEFGYLRPEHIIFTNIHSALDRPQLDALLEAKVAAAIAAENTHQFGSPNCALAGEVGALEAVRLTLAPHGGTGRHFMSHFGAAAAKAVVLGLGNVGRGALRTLVGLGVSVAGLDVWEGARKAVKMDYYNRDVVVDDISALENYLYDADMIVNCVLWPKEREDHLISRAMLRRLKPGAVIVDISCDTHGAIETSRATCWADPVYEEEGVRHFCVDNIPGAVPVTASAGYGEAILPKVALIAEVGVAEACRREPWIARGLTCAHGELILAEAGRFQKREFTPVNDWLARQK